MDGSAVASAGTLKARPLGLDSFRKNLVVLSRDSRAPRPARLRGARKELSSGSIPNFTNGLDLPRMLARTLKNEGYA